MSVLLTFAIKELIDEIEHNGVLCNKSFEDTRNSILAVLSRFEPKCKSEEELEEIKYWKNRYSEKGSVDQECYEAMVLGRKKIKRAHRP